MLITKLKKNKKSQKNRIYDTECRIKDTLYQQIRALELDLSTALRAWSEEFEWIMGEQ
jgi:hypothetical protein